MTQKEIIQKATLWGLKTLDKTAPPLAAIWAESLFLTPQFYPRTPAEEKVWQEGRKINLRSGRSLRVYGTGRRVVFLHGWESRGSSFYEWVKPLTGLGFQVALWDLPAHGDSPGKSTNMVASAKALEDDLNDWNQQEPAPLEAIVGHSFGGCTGLFAQLSGGVRPKKSVSIGSPSNVEGVITDSANAFGFSARSRRLFTQRLQRRTGLKLERGDFRIEGAKMEIPHLVVHDKKDKEVSFQQGLELHAGIAHSRFLATEGLGHRRILRDAGLIQLVGNFLLEQ